MVNLVDLPFLKRPEPTRLERFMANQDEALEVVKDELRHNPNSLRFRLMAEHFPGKAMFRELEKRSLAEVRVTDTPAFIDDKNHMLIVRAYRANSIDDILKLFNFHSVVYLYTITPLTSIKYLVVRFVGDRLEPDMD